MPTGLNDLQSQAIFTFRNSEFLYETSFYNMYGNESQLTHVENEVPNLG